jgi:hypothetical protein
MREDRRTKAARLGSLLWSTYPLRLLRTIRRSRLEYDGVVDLGVVAERVQIMLGSHDLRVAESLCDLGERVSLLAQQ